LEEVPQAEDEDSWRRVREESAKAKRVHALDDCESTQIKWEVYPQGDIAAIGRSESKNMELGGFHYNWKRAVRRDNASENEATHLGGEYARIEIAQYAKPGIGRIRSIAGLVNKSRTHVNNPNVKYRF
jgi:hypothetical protein